MIPAPSETGHAADDYETIFMPRDADRIRANGILEVWRGRRVWEQRLRPAVQLRLELGVRGADR